jgi:hypothetical protein
MEETKSLIATVLGHEQGLFVILILGVFALIVVAFIIAKVLMPLVKVIVAKAKTVKKVAGVEFGEDGESIVKIGSHKVSQSEWSKIEDAIAKLIETYDNLRADDHLRYTEQMKQTRENTIAKCIFTIDKGYIDTTNSEGNIFVLFLQVHLGNTMREALKTVYEKNLKIEKEVNEDFVDDQLKNVIEKCEMEIQRKIRDYTCLDQKAFNEVYRDKWHEVKQAVLDAIRRFVKQSKAEQEAILTHRKESVENLKHLLIEQDES